MTPENVDSFEVTDDGSPLPEAFVECERRLLEDPPRRVVIGDDSDLALAAAITALKLGLPVEAGAAATGRSTANGRLIAILAA